MQMPVEPRASEVFASRCREVRESRRWSQQEMADYLNEIGEPVDRSTIARTENRARGVSLDDAVAYSAALGPSLVDMITPPNASSVMRLTTDLRVAGGNARAWLTGSQPLRAEDAGAYYGFAPEAHAVLSQPALSLILQAARSLVAAASAGDTDAEMQALRDLEAFTAHQRREIERRTDGAH